MVAPLHPPEVLVVEDEEPVRRLLCLTLPHFGLSPLPAASGEEAVEIFRNRGRIAAALLDVQLGGPLDGPHTLAVLRTIDPELPCAFMTADPGRYTPEDLLAYGASQILAKPFPSLAGLADSIKALVKDRARAAG